MRVLVTAGPTREHLDDVRFLSNGSTGAMGIAVASEAARRGHEVTLVLGPAALPVPDEVKTERVVTAQQMYEAVRRCYRDADAVVMTAAVCDYRPETRFEGKMKKTGGELVLKLVPTPDILASLGREKEDRILIGFAMESGDVARENAIKKLREKNLDAIVLDSPAAMGADRASFVILSGEDSEEQLHDASKHTVAERIVDLMEEKGRT